MAQSFSQWARGASRWSGFSRGLAAGLLIAVFVAMLFSFHARQRIGDALIWLGERFEPTAKERAASSAARPSVASPAGEALQFRAPVIAAAAASSVSTTRPMARPGAQEPLLATVTKAAPRDRSKPAVAITPAPAVAFSAVESLPLTPVAPTAVPVSPETAQGALAASRDAASGEKVLAATAADRASETENAEDALEINSDMPLGKYFEVGKFKDELAASQILSGLNKLEFQAVVLPKSLLWMKSYEVLVGPYHDEQDAQSARRNLQAQGYKPRSLGKHSRELNVVVPWVNPNGGPEERDDFIVTWEAYSADASVKFVQADKVTRTVAGKWVKLPAKSEYNAIMYTKGKSGTRTLLSIQFRGMNRAVELGSASHRSIVF
ncbi:MAG TPA: SPOR domain-containing protein [Candidatus Cybelea sp.]|nr:SPOR domain-containing protein [Candidatus Cybelea sp.]